MDYNSARIKEKAAEYVELGLTWEGDAAIEQTTELILCDLDMEQLVEAGELDFADAQRAVEAAIREAAER